MPDNLTPESPKYDGPCVYDTNGDGDCQVCVKKGGCKSTGGPHQYKDKYFGQPPWASAGWDPKHDPTY